MDKFGSDDAMIDPGARIVPQIHRILRDRIVRNLLKPGEQISETETAERFGISRQPVREAFIRLSVEGLVTVLPQRGTRVQRITLSAVHDARFLREAIESDVVALLAANGGADRLEALRDILASQAEVATAEPLEDVHCVRFMRLDEAFHRTMAEGAGRGGIWEAVHRLKAQMDRVRFLSLPLFPMRELVRQHAAMLESIERRDAARATATLRRHLRQILDDLPAIMAANPELFDDDLRGEKARDVDI